MLRLSLNYLLLLLIGWLDHATGEEVHFGSFYLIAVAVATWSLRPGSARVFAVVTVVVWLLATPMIGPHFPHLLLRYWNVVNRLGTIVIVATAVAIIRATLDRQRQLIRELGKTSLHASQLRELIPICRICRILQMSPDQEQKLRQFLSEDPDADSVGGICPDCLRARKERIAGIPLARYFQGDPA